MSGPWFYELPVTLNGSNDTKDPLTDIHAYPGRDIQMDASITSASWVWVSVTERGSDGRPFLGAAPLIVCNVLTEDDGGVRVRIITRWAHNLNGLLKMLIWT
jgi:hypothetical protein